MVIGPVGAGKSTLLRSVERAEGEVKKTEALTYLDQAIDTPGEMIAIPHFYHALILNSVRAGVVLLLMDGHRPTPLPPRLALAMRAPVLGVVTKTDLAAPESVIQARRALERAGAGEILEVSAVTGQGLGDLRRRLAEFENNGPAGPPAK
jgi:ethanolamine utilization protein EutP